MSQEIAVAPAGKDSISYSESLRRSVNTKVMQIERSIVVNRMKKAQQAQGARAAIKEKVQMRIKENTALSRSAEFRVRIIDDTTKETSLWITKLHHERYRQYAALQVCKRRLELRECNPPELNKDILQDALEVEEKLLSQARDKFFDMEVRVNKCIEDLEGARSELSKDAARRRLAVTADRMVLVTLAMAGAVAPGAKALPGADGEAHGAAHEGMIDSPLLCRQSMQLEDLAAQLRQEAKITIAHFRSECQRARERVDKRLTKRTEQTLHVTKELIGQGKEVDYTIVMAQRSLSANQKFLDKKDQKQGKTYQAAENVLDQLRQSRAALSHDLRQRTILLSTSEACRKVTPQTASSPPPAALQANRPARPSSSPGNMSGTRKKGFGGSSSQTNLLGDKSPAGNRSPSLPALKDAHRPDSAPECAPESPLPEAAFKAGLDAASSPTSFEGAAMEPKEA